MTSPTAAESATPINKPRASNVVPLRRVDGMPPAPPAEAWHGPMGNTPASSTPIPRPTRSRSSPRISGAHHPTITPTRRSRADWSEPDFRIHEAALGRPDRAGCPETQTLVS